jgi:hypothetical protein
MKAAKTGIVEDDYRDLINFKSSKRYNDKQKAALAYAECITWDLPAGGTRLRPSVRMIYTLAPTSDPNTNSSSMESL